MAAPPSDATPIARAKDRAAEEVSALRGELLRLSRAIHDDPELSLQEHRAAARVADAMRGHGFAVTAGAYGIDTAVRRPTSSPIAPCCRWRSGRATSMCGAP